MTLFFHIHFRTHYGQQLIVEYHARIKKPKQLLLTTTDGEHWEGKLEIKGNALNYRYAVVEAEAINFEVGESRKLQFEKEQVIFLKDQWRQKGDRSKLFEAAAFTDVYFSRTLKVTKPKAIRENYQIQFNVRVPDLPSEVTLGIVGNIPELGSWSTPTILNDSQFPIWSTRLALKQTETNIEYKYVWCDPKTKSIVRWEDGDNRKVIAQFIAAEKQLIQVTAHGFQTIQPWWRAAGLALPVFSQRSEQGFGIGEFLDLIPLINFAKASGLKMVQVLPVNDTIASKTWIDSYPYAAISVHALHPLYINVEHIAPFNKAVDKKNYNADKKRLNALAQIDFEAVLQGKFKYLRILYLQEGKKVFASKAFKEFFKANENWLSPYAAFCHLRDQYHTPNFNDWPEHKIYKTAAIKKLTSKKSEDYPQIAFYYFLQFIADQQLKKAKAHGQRQGVVLKGDLPIGVYRYSADAWVAPKLFNMNEQAGAPPDDYAVDGQNWGFPTYNWEEMAKDNYAWWRERMQKLAEYFDALRIDHILGFFRIWQIPLDQVEGTLGLFNPRLPYSKSELRNFGFGNDLEYWTQPYIKKYFLYELFGADVDQIIEQFLEETEDETYRLKKAFKTQTAIKAQLRLKKYATFAPHLKSLMYLASEVLLIEEPGSGGQSFNPRITLKTTYFYKSLNEENKRLFDIIYGDYFFLRHDQYWKQQAITKLPPLLEATNMLICGEDLGMIPASVPGVMSDLNIIPLEIQRMPKGSATFGVPHEYDYFSVNSPSCHDMPTIRGWWEGDYEIASQFYHQHLRRFGEAPKTCTGEIVTAINRAHLESASILSIFPLQDLLGMYDELKRKDAAAEQINVPANPKHYWRYRFHVNIEELLKEKLFIVGVKEMVEQSGRTSAPLSDPTSALLK